MSKVEDFLTSDQEQKIIESIRKAEKNTSGEIRVHLENNTEKPPLERAKEVFYYLKMDETNLKNGVLIYLAIESKKFAILGDKGINDLVSDDFWNEEKQLILSYFKKNEYTEGLQFGIEKVGEKLKQYFPYKGDDSNELSDELSKG